MHYNIAGLRTDTRPFTRYRKFVTKQNYGDIFKPALATSSRHKKRTSLITCSLFGHVTFINSRCISIIAYK